jgi:hypothetical protein
VIFFSFSGPAGRTFIFFLGMEGCYDLDIDTVQLDMYSASFTLHWKEHLVLNGFVRYIPAASEQQQSFEHVHYFYNKHLYTTALLRVVLKYLNGLHKTFQAKMKELYLTFEMPSNGGKRRRLLIN